MILQEGEPGKRYKVSALQLPVELERRLEALGMIQGSDVTILRKKRHGAMIIQVRGTRFAVGYGISSHITVSGAESHPEKKEGGSNYGA